MGQRDFVKFIRLATAVLIALVICGTGIALGAPNDPAGESNSAAKALSAAPVESGIELDRRRTATSQTFALPSGALQTRIFESPIHYRGADGEWKPIDEGLKETASGSLTNGPNSFDLSLPERMGTDAVELSVEGEWVSAELLAPASEPARLDGKTATYAMADGTTFELTSLPSGVKEDIVLTGSSSSSSFEFELRASGGLMPVVANDGTIEFRDESKEAVVVLPAPVMFDSSPAWPEVSNDVDYALESNGEGRWTLTLEADREWLSQKDRVWPVTIDPTFLASKPSLDCAYGGKKGKAGWGNCGFEGQQTLPAGYWPVVSGDDEWNRSLLKFDLTSITAGAESPEVHVTGATLGLHSPTAASNTSGVEARRVTDGWTSQVNWLEQSSAEFWESEGGDYATSEGASILTSQRGSQAGWWNFSSGMAQVVS